jgi:hypothetical protein
MVTVCISGLTEVYIKVIGTRIEFLNMVSIIGMMVELTKATG